jgi:hypothetical protein
MAYLKMLRKRASEDTWKLIIDSPIESVAIGIYILVFTVFLTFLWKEKKDVKDLLMDAGRSAA